MSRLTPTGVHLVAEALGGRADAAAGVPGPYLVVDLGRGRDPHHARCRWCRWCRWRSWRTTAAQVWAEHARHQVAAHGRGRRPARRSRLGLAARRRAR